MRDNRPASLPASFPALRPSSADSDDAVLAAALAYLHVRWDQHDCQQVEGSALPSDIAKTPSFGAFDKASIDAFDALSTDTTWCSGGFAGNPAEQLTSALLHGDRRAFPRHESRCITLVLRHDQERAEGSYKSEWLVRASKLRGSVLDISMNGVAFSVNQALEKGDQIDLRLVTRIFDRCVDKQAVVLRSSSLGHGQWKIVCKFQQNISYDEVCVLGRRLISPAIV